MYSAQVQGRRLTFRVEAVWRRNMIIRDVQTGTLWQHATGEALMGPLAGTQLTLVGGERTTWASWRADYPHTTVAQAPAEWTGAMPRPVVERVLEKATQSGYVPGRAANDHRLDQNSEIAGLKVNGVARAYPLATLRKAGVVNDWLGEQPVAVLYEQTSQRVSAYYRDPAGELLTLRLTGRNLESEDGRFTWDGRGRPLGKTQYPLKPLPVTRTWWNGWYEFHSGTDIYQEESVV